MAIGFASCVQDAHTGCSSQDAYMKESNIEMAVSDGRMTRRTWSRGALRDFFSRVKLTPQATESFSTGGAQDWMQAALIVPYMGV